MIFFLQVLMPWRSQCPDQEHTRELHAMRRGAVPPMSPLQWYPVLVDAENELIAYRTDSHHLSYSMKPIPI